LRSPQLGTAGEWAHLIWTFRSSSIRSYGPSREERPGPCGLGALDNRGAASVSSPAIQTQEPRQGQLSRSTAQASEPTPERRLVPAGPCFALIRGPARHSPHCPLSRRRGRAPSLLSGPGCSGRTATAPIRGERDRGRARWLLWVTGASGYPVQPSKFKHGVSDNCPEGQCPEVRWRPEREEESR
jgi:hypothetical protein